MKLDRVLTSLAPTADRRQQDTDLGTEMAPASYRRQGGRMISKAFLSISKAQNLAAFHFYAIRSSLETAVSWASRPAAARGQARSGRPWLAHRVAPRPCTVARRCNARGLWSHRPGTQSLDSTICLYKWMLLECKWQGFHRFLGRLDSLPGCLSARRSASCLRSVDESCP